MANGVNFRAFIDNCTTNSILSDEALQTSQDIFYQGNHATTTNLLAPTATIEAFPNPFHKELTIKIELKETSQTSITVFDKLGRIVAEPLQPKMKESGIYEYKLMNQRLPQGLYLIVLKVNDQIITRKAVLNSRSGW